MPSPLAHLTVGALVARATFNKATSRGPFWKWMIACLFFSMAADLDAAPGVVLGNLGVWHNHFTHSVTFALAFCGAAFWPAAVWVGESRRGRVFATALGCYLGHVLMDWMTYGRGVVVAWPFMALRFRSPVNAFVGLRWSDGLRSAHHWTTLANEVLFGAIAVAVFAGGRWLRRRRDAAPEIHTDR